MFCIVANIERVNIGWNAPCSSHHCPLSPTGGNVPSILSVLSCPQIATVVRFFGANPTEGEIKALVDMADKDKNGMLSLDEFLKLVTKPEALDILKKPENQDVKEKLMRAFTFFDKNSDGALPIIIAALIHCLLHGNLMICPCTTNFIPVGQKRKRRRLRAQPRAMLRLLVFNVWVS
jgi:hypothetical protein